ncbi:hypothetical protein F2P81_010442 [Scophthalmus maximus]|uniref:Uncharacterized protein n=1 Tax=Scophthalmus maximus TaxID=52904 RepID=A0A6A4SZU6_SCOMX|nr:hypothetical protein F2P81_010442 [Scophthalmus maximus]
MQSESEQLRSATLDLMQGKHNILTKPIQVPSADELASVKALLCAESFGRSHFSMAHFSALAPSVIPLFTLTHSCDTSGAGAKEQLIYWYKREDTHNTTRLDYAVCVTDVVLKQLKQTLH